MRGLVSLLRNHLICFVGININAIQIKKEGYYTDSIQLVSKVSVGFMTLDICTGIIWLGVDFATGNIYSVRPKHIDYKLMPIPNYNPSQNYDFKVGDTVYFSQDKFTNAEGVITAIYPDRVLITTKREPTFNEKAKGIDGAEVQIEVPFKNVAKK